MAEHTKGKGSEGKKRMVGNPWGHYRKQQSIEEFAGYFKRVGDVAFQRAYCNDTATWVQRVFPSIELEVHQAGTFVRAARLKKEEPDYETVKKHCPRLAIVTTDEKLKQIESGRNPKDVTAGILSRILDRRESSIKRWALGKK
jgi:hypothetical protein